MHSAYGGCWIHVRPTTMVGSWRLSAAIQGNLELAMRSEAQGQTEAVTAGVREATEGLRSSLRAQVMNAGLGERVARAWRQRIFTNEGFDAAGIVWSNASRIIRANEGVTIRARDSDWLAIPTESAPRRGVGGRRISPSTFPEHRFGRLRFVYRQGAPPLLVVDELRASFRRGTGEFRGFRRAGKRARERGETTTVVMFVLVPQVSLPRRLDVDGEVARWGDRLPALIAENWPEEPT